MQRPLTKFTPTHLQLVAAIDDVAHEVEQLIGICHHLISHGPVPVRAAPETQEAIIEANVYLEAFLLHVRVLSDFFEARARSKRNGAELDDVLVSDYAFPTTPVGIPDSLRRRINQELTHLSYSRAARQDDHRNWVLEPMARALLTRCAAFAAHLQSDSSRHLLTQNTKARFEEIQRLIEVLLRAPKA